MGPTKVAGFSKVAGLWCAFNVHVQDESINLCVSELLAAMTRWLCVSEAWNSEVPFSV